MSTKTKTTDGVFGGSDTFATKRLPFVRATRFENCCGDKVETVEHNLSGVSVSSYGDVSREQQALFWKAVQAGLPISIQQWQH